MDNQRINLPWPLVDSHFHALEMRRKGMDVPALLTQLFHLGLKGGMEAAIDEENFAYRTALAADFPGIKLSAGIHPAALGGDKEGRMARVEEQLDHPLVRAVGETGLDFYREGSPREIQEEWFRQHLRLSQKKGLPVIIHNREADDRVLALTAEEPPAGGVLHCFSSSPETAEQALDRGLYLSFAGNITYKKSESIRRAAALVPSHRLLIETDSPYLSPQSVRGKPNHPGHLGFILTLLGEIRGEDPQTLAEITRENACRLFSLV